MTASKAGTTDVVVVDGSNIATEGRSAPSLSQLNDAVMAFLDEFPDAMITVVVDATFGHRIDKKEAEEFDDRRRPQRTGRPAGRSDRPGRRLRAQHRQQGRRPHPQQRLVPGVPRRLPVAVRRGPPHRRQAGADRRVGLRLPPAGQGPHESQGAAGRPRRQARPPDGEQGGQPADAGAVGAPAQCRRGPESASGRAGRSAPRRSPRSRARPARPDRRSTTCCRSSTSSSTIRSAAA